MPKDLPIAVHTVHDALTIAQAVDLARVPQSLIPTTVRLHPDAKEAAEGICARHMTTLSSYLRECVNVLVRDYAGAVPVPAPSARNPGTEEAPTA